MHTICRGVMQEFGVFADACWTKAQSLHDEQLQSRVRAKAPKVEGQNIEWDGRLTSMLLRTIPEELKQPVIEEASGLSITAVALCLAVLTRHQPGGTEEMTSLQKFVRFPAVANTFQEMAKVLRRYNLALSRVKQLALPELAPPEGLRAALAIAKNLERKNGSLQMRLNILRLDPATSTRPTAAGVAQVLGMLERECLDLAADERIKGSSAGDSLVAAAATDPTPNKRLCWWYHTPGGCRKGSACTFAHEKKGKGKGEGKGSKGKDGKGKVNQAEASSSSDAPKTAQETPPNPKSKAEAEAKADPKAKPKAKTKAAAKKLLGVDEQKAEVKMVRVSSAVEERSLGQEHTVSERKEEEPDSELNPQRTHVDLECSGGRGRFTYHETPLEAECTEEDVAACVSQQGWPKERALQFREFDAVEGLPLSLWLSRNDWDFDEEIWDGNMHQTNILQWGYIADKLLAVVVEDLQEDGRV